MTQSLAGVPRATTTPEARDFSRRQGLETALDAALDLVRKHFAVIAPPTVALEDDPETPDSLSLVIEAPVAGDPTVVAEAHWRFSDEAATVLGSQRRWINLVCDIRCDGPA